MEKNKGGNIDAEILLDAVERNNESKKYHENEAVKRGERENKKRWWARKKPGSDSSGNLVNWVEKVKNGNDNTPRNEKAALNEDKTIYTEINDVSTKAVKKNNIKHNNEDRRDEVDTINEQLHGQDNGINIENTLPWVDKPKNNNGNGFDISQEVVKCAEQIRNETLPDYVYAHLLLIDIDSDVKQARGIPRYLPIKHTSTLIGRYQKVHIYLDDPNTVKGKHAKVIYEKASNMNQFMIYPIESTELIVNKKSVTDNGLVLKNGDVIEIGSAILIFFMKDMGNGGQA